MPVIPVMLPAGKTMFLKKRIPDTERIGIKPRKKKAGEVKLLLSEEEGMFSPNKAPVPVSSSQPARIRPITSSFP